MATRYQIFKKSSSPNPVHGFENFFHRKIPQSTVYQSCSKNFVPLKNMAARGRSQFSIYGIYRKSPSKSSSPKPLNRIQPNFTWSILRSLPIRFVQTMVISKKTWPPGGGVSFPYMKYIEKVFQNLLLQNHWTESNQISHEASLGYSLSGLFKPWWYLKKHGRQGAESVFHIWNI